MFRKQALQTTLRTPRRSLLFLLLLALISALLASSLGMSASLSRALALCRENYSTIGLAEYISGGYPELSALDSAAGQAADALAAAVAPDDALLYYEPTRMALGDTDGLASRKTFDGGVLVLRVKQLVGDPANGSQDDFYYAVVEEARTRGLSHEEYHSQVQYVVAHGISSMVEGKKVIIGSAHFVFEDEGCRIPEGEQPKFDALPAAYSHLYLCMDGELAAVICIHDPLRREARAAVRALHESGFANVVMMTGDNRRTAEAVAAEVGVDAVYAEVLPEDKAAFIRQEKEKGHTVIMVGDGVNDSPALSEADAGIAISTGAAIAREIADITVASEDLFALVTLRRLGEALMERIHGSYRFIVGFNLTLIALGVAGVLPPTTSALLHNGSTLGISLRNMTDLLKKDNNA